jgi:archaeosine synthase beta-subunit
VTPPWDDARVIAARPERFAVDPWQPYAELVEPEHTAAGVVEPVATLFLTNRECPFKCVFCDLWRHTTTTPTPQGAIPAQIAAALARLPAAPHIKLYNSGNFFDAQAIPPEDHPAIAVLLQAHRTVIVENHPKLCGPPCIEFQRRLPGEFEIALGLETVHPDVLPRLNKRMAVDDYVRAAGFLREHGIHVRTFVLLNPPFLQRAACVEWALRSLETAFDAGARVCAVIPVRTGNGAMDQLAASGDIQPPRLEDLEQVQQTALGWRRGRVFVDLWDAERLFAAEDDAAARIARLHERNLTQM